MVHPVAVRGRAPALNYQGLTVHVSGATGHIGRLLVHELISAGHRVRASGAGWTILRPGTFATNLLSWSQPVRYTGGVRGPYPSSAQALIHEADVAATAVAALTHRATRTWSPPSPARRP